MIKYDKIKIEINKGNLPYYSKRYNININIGDIIEIEVNSLPIGSNIEILAICDICKSETNIKYKLYNKSFIKNGSFACSKKCAAVRTKEILMKKYGVKNIAQVPIVKETIKQTNNKKYGSDYYFGSDISKDINKNVFLEKWGVDNPLKSEEIKEKVKKTNLEKWGVEWTLQNSEVRERIKNTSLYNWGTETPSQNQFVKNKIIKTNQERYGGNSAMCNELIKEKSKKKCLDNWGVDNPNKSKSIRENTKRTNLEKLGVEYPTQSEIVRNKIKENNLQKWGTEHVHQSEIYRIENTKIGKDNNYLEYKGNSISLFKCDCGFDHIFEINTDNYFSRIRQNIPLCVVCYPIGDSKSFLEIELYNYIKSIYNGEVIQSYRDRMEIDIYLPDLKLGFEFNGLYWHSELFKDKWYHLNKTKYFGERGIKIIHIWEDDWSFNSEIIKSQIKNLLKLDNIKIFARKCQIKKVSSLETKNFLDKNHIQGYVNCVEKIGLYYNNELVSIMTFDNFEGRKKMENGGWNLSRFCNKIGFNVIGGASKLLKYFINEINPNRIISYADRDWSVGDLYYKLGFEKVSESKPDYKYIIGEKRVHKSNFKKSKLKTELTEREYMKSVNKVWNCGKLKFELYN